MGVKTPLVILIRRLARPRKPSHFAC